MSTDDNDDSERSDPNDTPEMRRLLETVSRLSPEKKRELLERWLTSEPIPCDSTEAPEGEPE